MAKSSAPRTSKASGAKIAKTAPAVRKVATKARKLAANPVVTEVVAATLVAAAAALKNPAKARALAESVADELQEASKAAATKTGAFWQLAMDIARRSVDTLGIEQKAGKPEKARKPAKPAKPKKAAKPEKPKKAKKPKKG